MWSGATQNNTGSPGTAKLSPFTLGKGLSRKQTVDKIVVVHQNHFLDCNLSVTNNKEITVEKATINMSRCINGKWYKQKVILGEESGGTKQL